MEEKDYQPILEQSEQPEEGFVPYCGSEEADARRKPKLYFVILGIAAAIAVLGLAVLLIGRNFNFYRTTLNTLQFDYRGGESTASDWTLDNGACAEAVSAEIGRQQVTLDAVLYLFDADSALIGGVSAYHNVHNVNEDVLTARSGSSKWFFTKKTELRVPLSNGAAPVTEEYRKPLLYELMFGTESHDAYWFECYDSMRASVGTKQYICEIWLMEDDSLAEPSYYTLYRYYLDGRLAGLRVLNDSDAVMEVYDIQSYTVG